MESCCNEMNVPFDFIYFFIALHCYDDMKMNTEFLLLVLKPYLFHLNRENRQCLVTLKISHRVHFTAAFLVEKESHLSNWDFRSSVLLKLQLSLCTASCNECWMSSACALSVIHTVFYLSQLWMWNSLSPYYDMAVENRPVMDWPISLMSPVYLN